MRIAVVASHPIQYQAPWFRALAREVELQVYFAHRGDADAQAAAGYGVAFQWDVDLLSGYEHTFLRNVSRAPNVFSFAGCDTPDLRSELERTRPDACIVTGWFLKTHWQAIFACRALGIPVLVRGDSQLGTPRAWWKRLSKEVLYRGVMSCFDGFLCVGRRNTEYVLHYGASPDRVFFAPHFVDNEFFGERSRMNAAERETQRGELGLVEDEIGLLFVGRFIELKRLRDVIDALALPELGQVRIRLVLVGAGPLEDALRTQAERLGVAVSFVGFKNQSALPRIYAACDVFVLASESETWGLVVNEAMACGLPAIVSDAVGCAPDMIDSGATGETFAVHDSRQLADALRSVVARLAVTEQRAEMQAKLRAKVDAYSPQASVAATVLAVSKLEALSQRAVSQARGSAR